MDDLEQQIAEEKIDPLVSSARLTHDPLYKRQHLTIPLEARRLLDRKVSLEETLEMLEARLSISRVVNTESMAEGTIDTEIKVNETMTDVVGDPVSIANAGSSNQPNTGQKNLLSVDDFFSRPISIYSSSLPIGSDVNIRLAVWDLYTKKPSVRAKFRNYSYFTGDLHVRLSISGTPFHYGKALVSYQAYAPYNDNITNYITNLGWYSSLRPSFLTYLSQAPGAQTIDFNGNRPLEVVCPFISPKGAHRLFNSDGAAVGSASSLLDFQNAGDLFIYSINQPNAVVVGASNIYLQVYAWMENVNLGPPSATQMVVSTESADERVTGPVQRFSSAAATVSNALSNIPGIAPLAKASAMVFNGVSGIASWFGWSRPNVLDEPKFVKNRPYSNMANTIGAETIDKITLDPLQELSVDPRICASEEDEMSLAFLAGVQSYLTTITWDVGQVPLASALWRSKVTPMMLSNNVAHAGYTIQQPTALAFAAIPFTHWRGTMKFRLEVVVSAFHRGKIAIGWEPNLLQAALMDTQYFLNKNYVKVIDIQETQDIEFCVHYASPYIWLQNETVGSTYSVHSTDFAATNLDRNNGFIYVVPFTELQSPIDADAFINVYVSGEEMQFDKMDPSLLPTNRVVYTNSAKEGANPQIDYTCLDLNESAASAYSTADVCFGEQPLSFRALCKRYSTQNSKNSTTSASAHTFVSVNSRIIPSISPSFGTTTTGQDLSPTLLRTLYYAYLGVKGGMRKKLRFYCVGESLPYQNAAYVQLDGLSSTNAASTVTYVYGNAPTFLNGNGGNVYLPHTNAGIEVELPYYSPNLFQFAFNSTGNSGTDQYEMNANWVRNFTVSFDSSALSASGVFTQEYATAEDFSLMRFNGAPYFSF